MHVLVLVMNVASGLQMQTARHTHALNNVKAIHMSCHTMHAA